jgi:hypothetical protein
MLLLLGMRTHFQYPELRASLLELSPLVEVPYVMTVELSPLKLTEDSREEVEALSL